MSAAPPYHDCSDCPCGECWMLLGSSEGEHRVHDKVYGATVKGCFCRGCGPGVSK